MTQVGDVRIQKGLPDVGRPLDLADCDGWALDAADSGC